MWRPCAVPVGDAVPLPLLGDRPRCVAHRKEVIQLQVVVQVLERVARALQAKGPAPPDASDLAAATEALGIELRAMHPGTEDAELAQYFIVEAPDLATAERLAGRLRQCTAVLAAYWKPADELP